MRVYDFDELWKALRKGVVRPAYYLHGNEELLKEEAVGELIRVAVDEATRDFNLDRRRAADLSADDFHSLVQTPPMMAPRRGVVVTEVEFLQQKKPKAQGLRAAVLAYAAHPSPDTVLILVQSPGADADTALSRAVDTVEFSPLPPHRLERWIRREAGKVGLTLEDSAITHLQATVGDDLSALAAELRKLGAAVSDRPATVDDVADLVGVRHGETLHDFVDAVTGRRAVEAAAMVPRLLDGPGVTPVRLLGAVGTALAGVGLARALLDDGVRPGGVPGRIVQALRVARPWGLRDWDDEASTWTRDAGAWTLAEVDAAMGELLRADRRVKNTKVATGGDILREAVLSTASGAA